jgi:hypothetical protein
MDILIKAGAFLSLAGVALLVWCILQAFAVRRRAAGDQTAMRAGLQRLVAVNFAALGLSAIGLMLVVVGIVLA